MKSQNKLTAKALKEHLWETLQSLKGSNIEVDEALAVAGLSREIVRCANTQIKVAIHTGRKIPDEVMKFTEN